MQASKKKESVSEDGEEILGAVLLDTIEAEMGVKNDAQLARDLDIAPPVISKIRHGKLGVSGDTMIRIHEAYDISIDRIKSILMLPVIERVKASLKRDKK